MLGAICTWTEKFPALRQAFSAGCAASSSVLQPTTWLPGAFAPGAIATASALGAALVLAAAEDSSIAVRFLGQPGPSAGKDACHFLAPRSFRMAIRWLIWVLLCKCAVHLAMCVQGEAYAARASW